MRTAAVAAARTFYTYLLQASALYGVECLLRDTFQRGYWSAALEQLKGPKPVTVFTPASSEWKPYFHSLSLPVYCTLTISSPWKIHS